MSDMRVEFWRDERDWPRDSTQFVFLARVVHIIGNQLFPDQWTGLEPQIKLRPRIPLKMNKEVQSNYLVKKLLDPNAFDSTEKRKTVFGFISPPMASAGEWRKAKALVAKDDAEKRPGLTRLAKVRDCIVRMAEAGKLITAVRPRRGGKLEELPSWYWNGENLIRRFAFCQMDPNDPFGLASAGDSFFWIFVSRASLDSAIKRLSKRTVESRAGRPEQFDWEEGKLFAFKLLEEKGDFKIPENRTKGWRSQNDLVERVIEHLAKYSDHEDGPSSSATISNVKDWLKEWRERPIIQIG
jgi:hypothetical protein